MSDQPEYGVVGTGTTDIDEAGSPLCTGFSEGEADHDALTLEFSKHRTIFCHPTVMMRRDVLLEVGGYHKAFLHAEDLDLWLRLASRTKMYRMADQLLYYRRSDDQVSVRHSLTQSYSGAIAYLAYQTRLAGRPDPTVGILQLPKIDELDILFGPGSDAFVSRWVAKRAMYSRKNLNRNSTEYILRYLSHGGDTSALWRTVAMMIRSGQLSSAAKLGWALTRW